MLLVVGIVTGPRLDPGRAALHLDVTGLVLPFELADIVGRLMVPVTKFEIVL